jgi:transcriptional regulator CtsR
LNNPPVQKSPGGGYIDINRHGESESHANLGHVLQRYKELIKNKEVSDIRMLPLKRRENCATEYLKISKPEICLQVFNYKNHHVTYE